MTEMSKLQDPYCRKCFDKKTDLGDQPCRSCTHNPEVEDRFSVNGLSTS